MFDNQKEFKGNLDAARILNISETGYYNATDRLSSIALNAADENVFRPMTISPEVQNSFSENAAKIGEKNPFETAADVIGEIAGELAELSLKEAEFPFIENPLTISAQSNPITGANTIPNLGEVTQAQMIQSNNPNNYNSLTSAQKLARYDEFDRIFRS